MKETTAIEIGKKYLKIAGVKGSNKEFICCTDSIASFDDSQISSLLLARINEFRMKPKSLALVLPRNLITVRVISLPSVERREIAKMIDLHLVRLVPYKKEEVVTSYFTLYTDDMGYTKILLCIAHRDTLTRMLKILADANTFVDKIYLTSSGVWEWFASNLSGQMDNDAVYLGLDIDYDYVELVAFTGKNLFFSRNIVIGSQELKDASSRARLAKEIKQALIFLRSEYDYKSPEKIFISGAVGDLEGIDKALERELEMPAKILSLQGWLTKFSNRQLNVSEGVSITAVKEILNNNPKRVSFYIAETQIRKSLRDETADLILIGSLAIYIFFIISAVFLGRIYNQDTYRRNLENYFQGIGEDVDSLISYSRRIGEVKKILEERKLPILFTEQIHNCVPQGLALDYINLTSQGAVILRGQSQRLSDVFAFIGELEKNEYFDAVEAKYTRKKKTQKGEFTNFELGMEFIQK